MPRPLVSVIVVAYGKREVTEACLAALGRTCGERLGREVELVLVDNASPDGGRTAELFRAWEDRARVLLLPENRQFSGGNNAGAAVARGEVLLLLNNDTEVTPGAVETLARAALEPGVGAVGCRLLYGDGTIQHGGFGWYLADGRPLTFHLFRHEAGDLPAARAVVDLDAVTGACLALRREVWDEVGGLDEGYVNGWEDIDLCVRVRVAGHRVVLRGDVAVVHHEGSTRGVAAPSPSALANARRFHERWGGILGDDADRLAATWDATWSPRAGRVGEVGAAPWAGIAADGAPAILAAPLLALGPWAAEARAWLPLLGEAAGWAPEPAWIGPSLDGGTLAAAETALRRPAAPDAAVLKVGPGPVPATAGGHVVTRGAAVAGHPCWAPTAAAAALLRDAGATAVEVVPSPVTGVPVSPEGEGVLALLPGHDPARCATALRAVAPLARRGVPVRVAPSVADARLPGLVASLAPGAELLPPVAGEHRVAALAADAACVVAADADDPFGRAALVAAAAGAAVVDGDAPAGAIAAALEAGRDATARREAAARVAGRTAEAAAAAAALLGRAATAAAA